MNAAGSGLLRARLDGGDACAVIERRGDCGCSAAVASASCAAAGDSARLRDEAAAVAEDELSDPLIIKAHWLKG